MLSSLAWSALLMGLVGGAHCVGMCGAACSGVSAAARGGARWGIWLFQAGRLAGYSLAGALVGGAMQGLVWAAGQTGALRPLWMLLHLAVLAWGLLLLVRARQPAWVEQLGRAVWGRVRPFVAAPGSVFMAGVLWTLMPCGLLYSALLVASLSGGPLQGALCMALFALASGLSLVAGPWLWRQLRGRINRWRQDWGTRIAGLLLALTALWALGMDLWHRVAPWCQ